ncbi:MAG: aminoglycoside 3'-phosphotransferase [Spirochaetes bacterium]|nr:aminoglycoside 3'-phosphotransferase [Spirochaetota bacterium]
MIRTRIDFDVRTLPESIQKVITGSTIYNSSCSVKAKTLLIDGKDKYYLKINKRGYLLRENAMTAFLHSYGLAPAVVVYENDSKHDYLLTEALPGEDGISGGHLDNPERLAAVFGESLGLIHALPPDRCPHKNRTAEMIGEVYENAKSGSVDLYIIPEGESKAMERFEKLKHRAVDDVVFHGDYCLPNIIMNSFSLTGFIDLGYGGFGDRHNDIFWGTWTLQYNLKTDAYRDIFLDAYGRKDIDDERLELCRLIAGLTG